MKENQPSSGLMALFENARPVNEIDREGFARDVRKLMDKPSFKAGVIKDQFIHNILEALDEEGISQSELARRWGKSRQYLSKMLKEDKRVNYTVDTMVEVMHHLGRRVEVHFPRANERTMVIHCLQAEPVRGDWKQPEKVVLPSARQFTVSKKTNPVRIDAHELFAA